MKLYNRIGIFAAFLLLCCYAEHTNVASQQTDQNSSKSSDNNVTQEPDVDDVMQVVNQDIPPVKHGDLDKERNNTRLYQFTAPEDERLKNKRDLAHDLVNKAVDYFKNNTIYQACRAFLDDNDFQYDEMLVFVVDDTGTIYAHGKDTDLIWRNINTVRKERKRSSPVELVEDVVEEMRKATKQDGWLSYEWNFEMKHAYVQQVEKNGRIFYVGTGFFPVSHVYKVQRLVDSAVAYAKDYGVAETIQRINNEEGVFVQGPMYLWLYDFDGNMYAHGRGKIAGRNRIDWQDTQGNYRNRTIVEQLQEHESMWIDYYESGNVLKRAYVRRLIDPRDGQRHFIGGGYYPEVDMPMVKDFVRRSINYLQTNGPKIAFRDFNSYQGGFRPGPLRVFVYNMEGDILADGTNPSFVGQNMLNVTDPEGKSVAKQIIEKAKKFGKGIVTLFSKDEYKDLYFEKVETPSGTYIVGSGYWPDSKQTIAESLAKKAATHLEQNPFDIAMRDFTTWDYSFVRGDLFVIVIDYNGIVTAYGPRTSFVWYALNQKTKEGYTIADILIETARTGGGWTSFTSREHPYHMYVTEVPKEMNMSGSNGTSYYAVGVYYIR